MDMWIILIISAVGLIALLWGAKILSKAKFTSNDKPKDKPKDKPQENKNPPPQQKIEYLEEKPNSDTNLADELRQLIKKDDQQNNPDAYNKTTRTSRIKDYHEKRWSHRMKDEQEFDMVDENNITISQEDIKKLVVLKDLFDNKPPN